MSYILTPEHAEHMRCEKDAYSWKPDFLRCAYLSHRYNKKYEYDANIKFSGIDDKPGVYEALIWGGMNDHETHWRDTLKAIILSKEITSACIVVKNSGEEKEFIVSSSHRRSSKDFQELFLPVPVEGIHLVALQYSTVTLRVESPVPPADVVTTFTILPKNDRSAAVQRHHVIKTFCQHDGGLYEEGHMYVFSGMIHDKEIQSCVVM